MEFKKFKALAIFLKPVKGIGSLLLLSSFILLLLGIHFHSFWLFLALVPLLLPVFPKREPIESVWRLIPPLMPVFIALLFWNHALWNQLDISWKALPINYVAISLVFFFTALAWKLGKSTSGYFGLVFFWLGYEYLMQHYLPQFAYPSLGSLLAKSNLGVNWFIECGELGGSFWVLVINVLACRFLRIDLGLENSESKSGVSIWFLAILIIPIIISFYAYADVELIFNAKASLAADLLIIPLEHNGQPTKYAQTGEFLGLIAAWMGFFLLLSLFVKDTVRLKHAGKRNTR
jgi:hypothetical protein